MSSMVDVDEGKMLCCCGGEVELFFKTFQDWMRGTTVGSYALVGVRLFTRGCRADIMVQGVLK